MRNIGIFGESGMAKDIEDCILSNSKEINILFINKSNEKDVQLMNEDDFGFIIGIGDNKIRFEISAKNPDLNWINVISDRSIIAQEFKLGVFPIPRSETAIKALAQLRGYNSGFNYVEGFELLLERG